MISEGSLGRVELDDRCPPRPRPCPPPVPRLPPIPPSSSPSCKLPWPSMEQAVPWPVSGSQLPPTAAVLEPTAPLPRAASISNLNYLFCGLANKDGAFAWYCGEPGEPVGGTFWYGIISSQAFTALVLTVWQSLVMPIAFYYLALVRPFP